MKKFIKYTIPSLMTIIVLVVSLPGQALAATPVNLGTVNSLLSWVVQQLQILGLVLLTVTLA